MLGIPLGLRVSVGRGVLARLWVPVGTQSSREMWHSRGTQVPVRIGVLTRPGVSSGLRVPARLRVHGAVESAALPEVSAQNPEGVFL